MGGTLFLVGTPIGNLSDFSPRGVEVLQAVDLVLAEDTRVSAKLLNHFEISKKMMSYHQHNEKRRTEQLIERLLAGENIAMISDAGMPCVSDPGEVLVREAHAHGIKLSAVPGPSAALTALAVSGQATKRFLFEGFLSTHTNDAKRALERVRELPHTLIFYEAPHRIGKTLERLLHVLGDRSVTVCRELTKKFEEISKTTLAEATEKYALADARGEFVLVVEGYDEDEMAGESTIEDALLLVGFQIERGFSLSHSVKLVAKETRFRRNELYTEALKRFPHEEPNQS